MGARNPTQGPWQADSAPNLRALSQALAANSFIIVDLPTYE